MKRDLPYIGQKNNVLLIEVSPLKEPDVIINVIKRTLQSPQVTVLTKNTSRYPNNILVIQSKSQIEKKYYDTAVILYDPSFPQSKKQLTKAILLTYKYKIPLKIVYNSKGENYIFNYKRILKLIKKFIRQKGGHFILNLMLMPIYFSVFFPVYLFKKIARKIN